MAAQWGMSSRWRKSKVDGILEIIQFSQRNINGWNQLFNDFEHAGSVRMFKNKIDTYLARAAYT